MEQNRSCREEEVPKGSREPFDQPQDRPNSGGITNRPLDREQCEQQQLPDRGRSQADQSEHADQSER
jgi:hypothetical protein